MSESKQVMSTEWIESIADNYPNVMKAGIPVLLDIWPAYESAVAAANALAGGEDAIRAAALDLFRNSGDKNVAKLDALGSKVAALAAELSEAQSVYNDAVDAATAAFHDQAVENAAKSGSGAAERVTELRKDLGSALTLTFRVAKLSDIPNLPTIPQRKRGEQDNDGRPKGWSPRLQSATVTIDGENVTVANAEGKDYPSMETIKNAIGISKSTREFSSFLLSRNSDVRELNKDGTTVTFKHNDREVSVTMVPRPPKAKEASK